MAPAAKEARRQQLYDLLGSLPDRSRAVTSKVINVERRGAYVREKLLLDLNGIELVPAYFVRPDSEAKQRAKEKQLETSRTGPAVN